MKPEIRIHAHNFRLRLKLGDGPARVRDGFGGYTAVDRPGNVAITEYTGLAPIKMDVPVLLDGFRKDDSVERDFARVMSLGRSRREPRKRPRPFRVTGPIPFSGRRFVLESTPQTSDEIRGQNGNLQRVAMVLPLMEFVSSDQIEIGREKLSRSVYKVRKGDTLRTIAKAVFGDVQFARLIGKENGIRDVRKELKAGRILKLPNTFSISGTPHIP